ncbi:NAD(P)H-hydrate dehydratase [Leisingera aquaemixtae]|uniref:NAD(P)H-hydrate dehydratase n=1 Tax=Leisingera aquaemixtae TaxID=1396826 RepID=UPI00398433B5
MTELLTAAQMRAIEQAAIESGEVTGLELMERAGQGVVEAIFEEWPELADERGPAPAPPEYLGKDEMPRRAVVLCGPGNNGGDGFVVARLLKERGWAVEVFLYGDPDKLPPDAKVNYERLGSGAVQTWSKTAVGNAEGHLFVDAIFGAGLSRAPESDILEPLTKLYTEGRTFGRMVAVDAPTGLCMNSGRALCQEYGGNWSWLTVTFHRPRIGHFVDEGPGYCGNLRTVDIGLAGLKNGKVTQPWLGDFPESNGGGGKDGEGLVTLVDDVRQTTSLPKNRENHKYTHGHALVLSGGHGKTGAARLAARGALRIGAGLVTVGSPRSAMFENAANLTAIMLRQIDGAHGLAELLEDDRLSALCLGPGMGRGADTQAMVFAALKEKRPTVLDADALTRFELKPEALFEALHENCVITPHGGEFARLFPDLAEKLKAPATTGPAYSKVDATREAAKRAGCVVLFKGPDTVIAAPDGRCSVNSAHYERSAPWLATAGSGDVLAGSITGLLARGFSPMQASETAAYIHVECALNFGPGLIAEDLPEQIPAVFRKLGL